MEDRDEAFQDALEQLGNSSEFSDVSVSAVIELSASSSCSSRLLVRCFPDISSRAIAATEIATAATKSHPAKVGSLPGRLGRASVRTTISAPSSHEAAMAK